MENQSYIQTFDDFLAAHPEINPEWQEIIEPVIQESEDALFSFIMSFIFM